MLHFVQNFDKHTKHLKSGPLNSKTGTVYKYLITHLKSKTLTILFILKN